MRSQYRGGMLMVGLMLAVTQLPVRAAEGDAPGEVFWNYSVSVSVCSYLPDGGLGTYRGSGSGSASNGGTVGLGFRVDGKSWTANIKPYRRDERLLLKLSIESPNEETEEREVDLSDLKPIAIDLAEASDGRVHYASITPRLSKIENRVETFSADRLSLDKWQFNNAPVLLNDAIYVGRLGGGGDVTQLSICDVADVEFSLIPIEGWKPWGVLKEGVLTITHPEEGTTVEIADTKNGPSNSPIMLPRGPYRVWVSWRASSFTSEQHHEGLKKVRQQIIDGEIVTHDYALQLIDKQLEREPGPWIYSSGFHSRPRTKGKP